MIKIAVLCWQNKYLVNDMAASPPGKLSVWYQRMKFERK
ncbi:unnamed protein product [Heterosigma akashiwo]